MIHKLNRICCYLKEMILKILFTVLGFFARLFCKPYRDLWLIMERGNDARDNGYWFFRYLREEHPEINCAYVITDDSIDRERVSSIGRTITYKSPEHYLAYYSAKYLLSTHVQPCAPDLILHYHLAKYGIRPGGKEVFLQHGIIKDEMQWLWRKNLHVDMFVCGAKPEYDYIKKVYGHPEGVVRYTGLCRFDNLIKAGEPDKMILVMPTWRGSGYPSGSDFVNTAYYKSFQGLLNSRVLDGKLKENGYKLVFYPHIEMQKDMKYFSTASERIILADKEHFDVQNLLMTCSLLITDYSSVFFDVAYLKRPELFYQFDAEEFREYHYKKGYFDYERDGFGEVCYDEERLLAAIGEYLENGMKLKPGYEKRTDSFFLLYDDKNRERTFETVQKL